MTRPINSSSWILEVLYKRIPARPEVGVKESRYLAIFTKGGEALLYGPDIPSHLAGLVQAGLGGRSVGRAYHKLVKGKYQYQKVEDKEKVKQLRQMMVL